MYFSNTIVLLVPLSPHLVKQVQAIWHTFFVKFLLFLDYSSVTLTLFYVLQHRTVLPGSYEAIKIILHQSTGTHVLNTLLVPCVLKRCTHVLYSKHS